MSSKVDDFFITPLEAHYECAPTEGPRNTMLEDLSKFTPDELHAGAEWLKRNKQSTKSFPSPKECNAAMEAIKSNRVMRNAAIGEKITRETYSALAVEYCKRNNHEGAAIIITDKDGCWEDWKSYYRSIGMIASLDVWLYRTEWTVPSMFPTQFDPTFKV